MNLRFRLPCQSGILCVYIFLTIVTHGAPIYTRTIYLKKNSSSLLIVRWRARNVILFFLSKKVFVCMCVYLFVKKKLCFYFLSSLSLSDFLLISQFNDSIKRTQDSTAHTRARTYIH